MTTKKQVQDFVKRWIGKGDEKQQSQTFWIEFLQSILDVKVPSDYIEFEDRVKLDHTSFIDGYIEQTHTMIEQKSITKSLDAKIKQSDGTYLTPFEQAKRYASELPYSQRPRWIITSNFKSFRIYDMEKPQSKPAEITLQELPDHYHDFSFMINEKINHIDKETILSVQAGEIVHKIYDKLLNQYLDPNDAKTLKSANMLIVRLVFCLYAEDAGLFGDKDAFYNYMAQYPAKEWHEKLVALFKVLNTPEVKRDPYLDDDLAAFPYTNGGLFKDEIEVPRFNDDLRNLILNNASREFNWSHISPTIFGAVFESTLDPAKRHSGGMHYTSIENIHKVIDPLFLDDFKAELAKIKAMRNKNLRKEQAEVFQNKLSKLTFLDPACGSGNFLTETYLCLRRLENECIKIIYEKEIATNKDVNWMLDDENHSKYVKVSIQQFYGIEINDFAVAVAKTSMWIAQSQMLEETNDILYSHISFLPLQTFTNIYEDNALRIDWNQIISSNKLNYIIGNPPFVGTKLESKDQKKDIINLNRGIKGTDYVVGWYYKAALYMKNTSIEAVFVSTNSITQGQQVERLWKTLNSINNKLYINFAYKSFAWDNQAKNKAHVHVVIIGFSSKEYNDKLLFTPQVKHVKHINYYLFEGKDIFITSRRTPLQKFVPKIIKGSQPTGKALILNEDKKNEILFKEPELKKFIKKYMGAIDLINNTPRYCLWLKSISPSQLNNSKELKSILEKVKTSRLKSNKKSTRKWASVPQLFTEDRQPSSDYLMVPVVSSSAREYIPMDFVSKDVIANTNAQMIPNTDNYTLGILESRTHMIWVKTIAGRMENDYAYSGTIVYNNFIWPQSTDKQKQKIKDTAQKILDARALYPDSSLADLYNPITMPIELRKAHEANDQAVIEAYGWDKNISDDDILTNLFKLYEKYTSK